MNRLMLLLLIPLALHAFEEEMKEATPFSQVPLAQDIVNPLSGQVTLRETDLLVKGAQDLVLERIFFPPPLPLECHPCPDLDLKARYQRLRSCYFGWQVLPHLKLFILRNGVRVMDQTGALLEFYLGDKKFHLKNSATGFCNWGGDSAGAHIDPRTIEIRLEKNVYLVTFPDGLVRRYEPYGRHARLTKELLPNGKTIRYIYEGAFLSKVETCDRGEKFVYASLMVDSNPDGREFRGSNHTFALYRYDTKIASGKGRFEGTKFEYEKLSPRYISSVQTHVLDHDEFSYSDIFCLERRQGKKQRFECSYAACSEPFPSYRVATLRFPNGEESFS
ncbi:MAG: hypothetical protein KDK48_05895, partial [Chlamydiia bacterium]|nr:hypothetical protein [Chlamydiia bacterium]